VGNCLKSFKVVYPVLGKKSSVTTGKLKSELGDEINLSALNLN
jgi:hypothetical protein